MELIQFLLGTDVRSLVEVPGHFVTGFSDFDAFIQSGMQPDGVLISCSDAEMVDRLIRRLRTIPAFSAVPIFLLNDLDPWMEWMIDGKAKATDSSVIIDGMAAIAGRMRELPPGIVSQGQDFRLLAYLYCRPSAVLRTARQWQHRQIHTYPIAELLADPGSDVDRWLNSLVERGHLERVELLDRLRICPKCGGCHHNFVDVCPHSRSIDIVQKPFLHCFTCGHVAPEESFLNSGFLVCPNCAERLRHIGADYDRPLENYVCNDCGQSFIEPLVIARCLSCGAENPTETLVPRQIYSLRLAERGRMAVQTGSIEDIYALFDRLNYVKPQFFEDMVDWLLALCRRYADERFSLIGIRLTNVLELTDHVGRHRVTELLDEFARRLREAIRGTDVSTRTSERTLWLLLPKTGPAGCKVLLRRLEDIRKDTRQPDGVEIELEAVTFSAPADMVADEPAGLLLARLMGELE